MMEKELFDFIKENELSPFTRTRVRKKNNSILKTKESKEIYNLVIQKISKYFQFKETSNMLNFFNFEKNSEEITKRQQFFKKITKNYNNSFLKNLKEPNSNWSPVYSIIVVTSDESTFMKLKSLDCPSKLLMSEHDLVELENYDIVQVLDCEDFSMALEQLQQSVPLNNIDEVYLERYLEQLSGWKNNINILKEQETNKTIQKITSELFPLLDLLNEEEKEKITREKVEEKLEDINEEIENKLREINIKGQYLFEMLSKGNIPKNIEDIINNSIQNSNLPEDIFEVGVPLKINESELDKKIKKQEAEEFTSFYEKVKDNSEKLIKIPKLLEDLSSHLILFDFIAGISNFIKTEDNFPRISQELQIQNSKNILIENPQPISFYLNEEEKCSILTGANSGGKTTLIEHILQLYCLFQIGLPVSGIIKMPLFNEIYYFAKNKGEASRGAFENLLEQIADIDTTMKQEGKTLILADEIEAVTEPGAAGDIITATSSYFINKNCFLVIATHLGQEIKSILPEKTRIDGIEAKGLDKNFNLMVDHNPVNNKLASSTPELIVEKLSQTKDNSFFKYLNNYLKNK